MKKLLTLAVVLLSLSACRHHDEPEPTRRTLLVYMEARNNLSMAADLDLNEMKRASVPADCRLLVYHSTYGAAPALAEVRNGELKELRTYDRADLATDPSHMRKVLRDAALLAPANERALVLWSHGSGWTDVAPSSRHSRSFGFEYFNPSASMSPSDMAKAMEGADLEYIYFDACFMASAEVAYELRHCAPYMVASPAETPAPGMPYDLTLPALFKADVRSGLTETIDIVADYYDANPSEHRGCPRTLSLIDLGAMYDLADRSREVMDASGGVLPEGFTPQRFALLDQYKNLYFDLEEYMTALGADARWRAALNRVVVYERHSPMIWNTLPLVNCCGLTVFIPNGTNDYSTYGYSSLEWAEHLNLCRK